MKNSNDDPLVAVAGGIHRGIFKFSAFYPNWHFSPKANNKYLRRSGQSDRKILPISCPNALLGSFELNLCF